MDIFVKLDYDTRSIIFNMLADDFTFFMGIKDNNMLPNKSMSTDHLDWELISTFDDLQMEFIIEYADLLNWQTLTITHKYNHAFIRKFKDWIYWNTIDQIMTFAVFDDYSFFKPGAYLPGCFLSPSNCSAGAARI